MPWKSDAQRRWGNSPAGRRALGNKVEEFNSATKGMNLPERKAVAKSDSTQVRKYQRTVDPAGTDPGAAKEIEDLAARKKALSGFQPSKPELGNPIKQIGGAVQKVGSAIKKALYPQIRPATAAEDLSSKRQGERAYYQGVIQRNTGRRVGGVQGKK